MSTFSVDWDATFSTVTGLNGASISGNTTTTGSTVLDLDTKLAVKITVEIAYGATASPATLYLLADSDDTPNFESPTTDQPFSMTIPGVASTTIRRSVTVRAEDAGKLKVAVNNPSGNSSITATVRYKYAVGTAA